MMKASTKVILLGLGFAALMWLFGYYAGTQGW